MFSQANSLYSLFMSSLLLLLIGYTMRSINCAPCSSASSTSLSSPPTKSDIFWSSRNQFLAAHIGDDIDDCDSASSDHLKTTDNFQFIRIPNEHQWEAEHLRGSKKHKIYRQLKIDHLADRAESVAQWTDEEDPKAGYGGRLPHSGAHRLGKQVIIWT